MNRIKRKQQYKRYPQQQPGSFRYAVFEKVKAEAERTHNSHIIEQVEKLKEAKLSKLMYALGFLRGFNSGQIQANLNLIEL